MISLLRQKKDWNSHDQIAQNESPPPEELVFYLITKIIHSIMKEGVRGALGWLFKDNVHEDNNNNVLIKGAYKHTN